MNSYLPMNAETMEEVLQYYRVREAELGAKLTFITEHAEGVYLAVLSYKGSLYNSIYITPNARGKGLIKNYTHLSVVTSKDCGIESVLDKLKFSYVMHKGWCDFEQYKTIKQFYGDKKAKRSQEFLMWHITAGCRILEDNGASDEAIKAFMLHPIFQSDEDFKHNKHKLYEYCEHNMDIVLNVLEYRKCANAYLCKPYTDSWTLAEIKEAAPIVLEDVRQMLIADKVQNQADFLKHHFGTHPRSEQLAAYFDTWLKYLQQ